MAKYVNKSGASMFWVAKKYASIFLVLSALSACSATSGQVVSDVDKAIAAAKRLCGVIPTVTSVVAFFGAFPGAGAVDTAAQKICAGVKALPGSESIRVGRDLKFVVDGIEVEVTVVR